MPDRDKTWGIILVLAIVCALLVIADVLGVF